MIIHSAKKFIGADFSSEAELILLVLGKRFQSPSYATLLGIQDAGSERTTVNGWTSWRTESGRSLAELRAEFLARSASPTSQS